MKHFAVRSFGQSLLRRIGPGIIGRRWHLVFFVAVIVLKHSSKRDGSGSRTRTRIHQSLSKNFRIFYKNNFIQLIHK
jgi:hypothetical protein